MAERVFEVKQATYAYHGLIPALGGVNVCIERGSKVALMGANGTGKSTLLTLLDALIFPDAGEVYAFGRRLTEAAFRDPAFSQAFRQQVGFVFQNPDIQLFCPTVREDLEFGPVQLGAGAHDVRQRLERVSEQLHLQHLLDRAPHQLSVGEKKRVALATVLIMDPQVLLLDEPTAGLDPKTTRDLMDIILAEHAAGKTVVTATHDVHLVEEMADCVHVFGEGKTVMRSLPPTELLADEAFLQDHNLIHVHRHRHGDQVHVHAHQH